MTRALRLACVIVGLVWAQSAAAAPSLKDLAARTELRAIDDNPLGNKSPTVSKGSQSVRACKLKEEPLGTIINAETGQPFTYQDPCVQTDPHTGYNEPAANATRKAVKDFVRTVFKLE